MREKLDNFLLSFLWIIVATLGACFWFNIRFGFNIFSGAHWRHLAYMQATQTPVHPIFYVSMIVAVVVLLGGLYILVKPRIRKIKFAHKNIQHTNIPPQTTPQAAIPTPKPTPAPNTITQPLPTVTPAVTPAATQVIESAPAPAPVIESIPTPTPAPQPISAPSPSMARPARLNVPASPAWNLPDASKATPATAQPQDWPELREIFDSAGYTTKETPRIGNVRIALLAIGADENLWIGAVGISTEAMKTATEKLHNIFIDTLEDIEIHIHGFVISATDGASPTHPEILTFDTPDALRQYMSGHTNPSLTEDERENFDAFSTYISTVVEYLGNT